MSDQISPDVTSDDKLWAGLSYPIWFIPIIVLLMDDKKERPFIKAHAVQALVFGFVLSLVAGLLTTVLIGCFVWPIGFAVQLYWGWKAYNGEYVTIPVLTDFVKNQGWA